MNILIGIRGFIWHILWRLFLILLILCKILDIGSDSSTVLRKYSVSKKKHPVSDNTIILLYTSCRISPKWQENCFHSVCTGRDNINWSSYTVRYEAVMQESCRAWVWRIFYLKCFKGLFTTLFQQKLTTISEREMQWPTTKEKITVKCKLILVIRKT